MEKIGIFGGTFDPIHNGHLIIAQTVLEKRNLNKIIFIPAFISPHKVKYDYSAPIDRYEMTKLAIEGNPAFEISDYEIRNEQVSYTVNTILEFKKRYEHIELIIGFDNLINFDLWFQADKIIDLAELIVLKRTYDKEVKKTNKFFAEAHFVDSPTIEISSTEIRERILDNRTIDYLVPCKVKEYIQTNKLYTQS